jgi:hypothetical protein
VFEGSIQTPLVRAESGNDLRYVTSTSFNGSKHPNKVNQLTSVNELTYHYFNSLPNKVGIGYPNATNAGTARSGARISSGRHFGHEL